MFGLVRGLPLLQFQSIYIGKLRNCRRVKRKLYRAAQLYGVIPGDGVDVAEACRLRQRYSGILSVLKP